MCRLGGVESIYTSVSARYVVGCPEWQRVTDQINAAAVSLCNTETLDVRIAVSSSKNAVNFSSARTINRFPSPLGKVTVTHDDIELMRLVSHRSIGQI